MAHAKTEARRCLRRPTGCEGHLTRRQAADLLGFASEFKIREFERQGLLRSVRGPMRAAFYSRAEILAVKAQLAQREARACPPEDWTDADLIALLDHPNRAGQARTALDLVTETRISIDRAERVHDFWTSTRKVEPASASVVEAARPDFAVQTAAAKERRSVGRLSRDSLIQELRSPDPRVREQAFERLREGRDT